MTYGILKRNGSWHGVEGDTDNVSEAVHFHSKTDALTASMRWVGSHVKEIPATAVCYEGSELRSHPNFHSHIAEKCER